MVCLFRISDNIHACAIDALLIMISNANLRCYTKFDMLWKNVKPIKLSVT